MASFWKFAWAFTRQLWALMSCAAFTALGLISALATNGSKWTVAGTIALAVVFGIVGSFQLWYEQHKRAVRAESDLQRHLESPKVTSKDWKALAQEAEQRCQFYRVDCHWSSSAPRQWEMKGGVQAQICEALARQAGNMPLASSASSSARMARMSSVTSAPLRPKDTRPWKRARLWSSMWSRCSRRPGNSLRTARTIDAYSPCSLNPGRSSVRRPSGQCNLRSAFTTARLLRWRCAVHRSIRVE